MQFARINNTDNFAAVCVYFLILNLLRIFQRVKSKISHKRIIQHNHVKYMNRHRVDK